MKAATNWDFHPYAPLNRPERLIRPYICRIEPSENGFVCDFLDNGSKSASHTIFWRKRDSGDWDSAELGRELSASVAGLETAADYEFYIERAGGEQSEIRLVRTGEIPGKIVNYLHPDDKYYAFSGRYLCSPSLVKLDDGTLLASMDLFAGGAPQNLTLIYSSEDGGKSWKYKSELFPCFWGRMFVHRGGLYMLGVSQEYGDMLIGRSYDGGYSWTAPTVLFRGSCDCNTSGCHRAPMPVCEFRGRLWTDMQFGAWQTGEMDDGVLSCPADADLLNAENWVVTEFWRHADHVKTAAPQNYRKTGGGIEGNAVVCGGKLYDFLRYVDRKWLLLKLDPDAPEKKPQFDSLIDFDASPSKVDVVWDEVSGYFYTIYSRSIDEPRTNRNLLSLGKSKDLRCWEHVCDLIDRRFDDPAKTGFQYVSFLIDGDDIIYLSRTALNCPHNFHDSNYSTFHRIEDFRKL